MLAWLKNVIVTAGNVWKNTPLENKITATAKMAGGAACGGAAGYAVNYQHRRRLEALGAETQKQLAEARREAALQAAEARRLQIEHRAESKQIEKKFDVFASKFDKEIAGTREEIVHIKSSMRDWTSEQHPELAKLAGTSEPGVEHNAPNLEIFTVGKGGTTMASPMEHFSGDLSVWIIASLSFLLLFFILYLVYHVVVIWVAHRVIDHNKNLTEMQKNSSKTAKELLIIMVTSFFIPIFAHIAEEIWWEGVTIFSLPLFLLILAVLCFSIYTLLKTCYKWN